jgi:prophage regulatory protein
MTDQPIRLLRLPEILHRVPYSEAHIWRLERAGKFPRRAHLGANRVAWVEAEVEAWIEERVNARPEGA